MKNVLPGVLPWAVPARDRVVPSLPSGRVICLE